MEYSKKNLHIFVLNFTFQNGKWKILMKTELLYIVLQLKVIRQSIMFNELYLFHTFNNS